MGQTTVQRIRHRRTRRKKRPPKAKQRLLLSCGLPLAMAAVVMFTANPDQQRFPFGGTDSSSGFTNTYSGSFSDSADASKKKTLLQQDNSPEWSLRLVNQANPLPDTYTPELQNLANGYKFDKRAIGQLNAMLAAARAQGLSPWVCSGYRSPREQQSLYDKQLQKQLNKGLSPEQAAKEARKIVAYPGTSEHGLGLAVDIVARSYQHLDAAQASTAEVRWLTEHCSEYGFIQRYPQQKTEITGITDEPWHFRYVGVEAAKKITARSLCLEEYLNAAPASP